MFRLLIISNDIAEASELNSRLAQMGFACSIVTDSISAIEAVGTKKFDTALVDIKGLSASDWASIKSCRLREIKSAGHLPIILLMPLGMLDGVASGLEIDDFVVRPFDLTELDARIRRTIKRTTKASDQDLLTCGDLVIDLAKCEVFVNGRLIVLTFKEYELLKFLMRHKERVFTREALLKEVWGYDYYGGARTVDVHIRRLRSKIEDADNTFIETVRNIGYKFIA